MSRPLRVAAVFGTRPEAIKMFPVVAALRADAAIETHVVTTGQHREILHQILDFAGLVPDVALDLMEPDQTLDRLTARLIEALGMQFDRIRPDRVLVQGDTATAMCGALAAYYRKIPVGHVEAGLRSGDIHHPWPEEVNRKIIGGIADLHFAPTPTAAAALVRENVPAAAIHVVGNSVVDALHLARGRLDARPGLVAALEPVIERFAGRRIVLVTSHRRENFGEGMRNIATAIRRIAARADVGVIFPVHPNPNVRAPMQAVLGDADNVAMIDPQDYPHFVRLLDACHLVLTDSGGVQEEAPALGKPVLVMRDTTERPEGIEAGTARLVGSDPDTIVAAVARLLDDPAAYAAMARAHNPFGDGRTSDRIVAILRGA